MESRILNNSEYTHTGGSCTKARADQDQSMEAHTGGGKRYQSPCGGSAEAKIDWLCRRMWIMTRLVSFQMNFNLASGPETMCESSIELAVPARLCVHAHMFASLRNV